MNNSQALSSLTLPCAEHRKVSQFPAGRTCVSASERARRAGLPVGMAQCCLLGSDPASEAPWPGPCGPAAGPWHLRELVSESPGLQAPPDNAAKT